MATYDFDQTGTNPLNRYTGSVTIANVDGDRQNFFGVNGSPFYTESVTVVNASTGEILIPGTDYYYANPYEYASDRIGKQVCGRIAFSDPTRTGTYNFSVQLVGGTSYNDSSSLLNEGLETEDYLTNYKWEDIVGLPDEFEPTYHTQSAATYQGYAAMIARLEGIADAILNNQGLTISDVEDLDTGFINPILENLSSILAALEDQALAVVPYFARYTTSSSAPLELTTPSVGEWIDTGIEIFIEQDGTYDYTFDINPKGTWDNEADVGTILVRWATRTSTGSLTPQSNADVMSYILGFLANRYVGIQIYINASVIPTKVALSGTNFNSTMKMVQLLNANGG